MGISGIPAIPMIITCLLQGIPMSQSVPCNKHVIIMGIAGMPEIPIVSHFRYACRYCIRKICIPYMLLAQNLQEIPTNFTEISTKIDLLHDFPTFNVGYPHGIPVKSKSLQFLHGNQSVEIFKLQGLRVYMQSP